MLCTLCWLPIHRVQDKLSTRIKDAGIAIRHSRGYIISILQGLEMGWKGRTWCVQDDKIIKKGSQIIKKKGSPQSSKSQNGFVDHPSPILKQPPPFFKRPHTIFAIFGRASGQIFEKMLVLAPFGAGYLSVAKMAGVGEETPS